MVRPVRHQASSPLQSGMEDVRQALMDVRPGASRDSSRRETPMAGNAPRQFSRHPLQVRSSRAGAESPVGRSIAPSTASRQFAEVFGRRHAQTRQMNDLTREHQAASARNENSQSIVDRINTLDQQMQRMLREVACLAENFPDHRGNNAALV